MTTAVQLAQQVAPGVSLGFKNRIINGAMTIDQRNAGASITNPNGSFPVDRFRVDNYIATTTTQRSTTAPTGFTNSLLVTNGTAASPSAAYTYQVYQNIEGYNVADLGFGAAGALPLAVSFWVRSSLTGTFPVSLGNSGLSRSYVATYTINAANTWEYKTIAVTGDASGTWLKDNSLGMQLCFDLGSGSNYVTSTTGAWQTGAYFRTSGCVNFNSTTGATFYITGVQLEVGTAATNFEFRDYGRELIMCQRYYQKSYDQATVPGTVTYNGCTDYYIGTATTGVMGISSSFAVVMRTAPSVTSYDGLGASGKCYKGGNGKTATASQITTSSFLVATNDASSAIEMNYQWTASAEL